MRRNRLGWGLAVLLTVPATAFAQKVSSDYDHSTTFSSYKTYYWEKVQTANPLWNKRVQDAVDKQLQAKGWQKVESGGDVAVVAVSTTEQQKSLNTFYDGWGGGWGWGGFGGMGMGNASTTVSTYEEGTLVIDMYDATTKQLIWRGNAVGEISDKPDKTEKTLNKATGKMFKKFPPGSDKN